MLDLAVSDDLVVPEAEVSRERQRRAREQVIKPLEELAERNQFAAVIRASLIEGRGKRT